MPNKATGKPDKTHRGRLTSNGGRCRRAILQTAQSSIRIKFNRVQSAAVLMAATPKSRKHIASATSRPWTASETVNLETRVIAPANDKTQRRRATEQKIDRDAIPPCAAVIGWQTGLAVSPKGEPLIVAHLR